MQTWAARERQSTLRGKQIAHSICDLICRLLARRRMVHAAKIHQSCFQQASFQCPETISCLRRLHHVAFFFSSPRDSGTPLLHLSKHENARTVPETGLGFLNPLQPSKNTKRSIIKSLFIKLLRFGFQETGPYLSSEIWLELQLAFRF